MSQILNYLINIAIGSDPSISHAYAHFPVKPHRSISCLKASNILFQRLALSYNINFYAHILPDFHCTVASTENLSMLH